MDDSSSSDDGQCAVDEFEDGSGSEAHDVVSAKPKARVNLLSHDKKQQVCHVCKQPGHAAGFVGAVYFDCINKPCYLCKKPGHSTSICPYRVPSTVTAAGSRAVKHGRSLRELAWARETAVDGGTYTSISQALHSRPRDIPTEWRVEAAVLRLHSRRIACMHFHGADPAHPSLLLAGDKSGELSIWKFATDRSDRVVYGAHRYLINAICGDSGVGGGGRYGESKVWTCSADGTVRLQDLNTRQWDELINLNPQGWTGDEKAWRMFYALSVPTGAAAASSGAGSLVLAGDDIGRIWGIDDRHRGVLGYFQGHKKGSKVQHLHHNPVAPQLVVSAGNDWRVALWDVRTLSFTRDTSTFTDNRQPQGGYDDPDWTKRGGGSGSSSSIGGAGGSSDVTVVLPSSISKAAAGVANPLAAYLHPRVVNCAVFSPHTGNKLLTTCIDNRLRVWDDVTRDVAAGPTRELVHSHDFGRYLSPFKAQWYTPDTSENRVLCGRYISEAFALRTAASSSSHSASSSGSGAQEIKLHPIDILDASTTSSTASTAAAHPSGVVAQLLDPLVATISPVNIVHPTQDCVVTGSSRSLFLWKPAPAGSSRVRPLEDSQREDTTRAGDGADTVSAAVAVADADLDGARLDDIVRSYRSPAALALAAAQAAAAAAAAAAASVASADSGSSDPRSGGALGGGGGSGSPASGRLAGKKRGRSGAGSAGSAGGAEGGEGSSSYAPLLLEGPVGVVERREEMLDADDEGGGGGDGGSSAGGAGSGSASSGKGKGKGSGGKKGS